MATRSRKVEGDEDASCLPGGAHVTPLHELDEASKVAGRRAARGGAQLGPARLRAPLKCGAARDAACAPRI